MHEGALTEDLFEHVMIHAREAKAIRVNRVKVSLGALSDATPESIQFYWETMAPGTIAEGAQLEFERMPGRARCAACRAEFQVEEIYAACPNCGHFPAEVISGNAVTLSSLEVETDQEENESHAE